MSTHSCPFPTAPTSVVRNTHSESEKPSRRRDLRRRLGPRNIRSVSGIPEARHGRSESPRKKGPKRKMVFKRMEKVAEIPNVVTRAPAQEEHNVFQREMIAKEGPHAGRKHCPKWKTVKKDIGSQDQKGKSLRIEEDDLSQPCVCEETDAFTPRIRYLDFPKTQMPSHVKTYDGSEDPEDHLKIFQAAAKTKRWAMPTCYDDLKKAFLENYPQQKKRIKDPVEIHNIKKRDGESTEEFVRRYKLECRDVKGDPRCMKISRFMHGITSLELIKRLHDKIPKSVDEMMRVTIAFIREAKLQEMRLPKPTKVGAKQDRFTLLTKTPKEILALDKGKFKPHPPMTTQVEKRNASKFCEFYGDVGHTTDECMHLKRQIEEMLKAGKLSHLIKEIKQNNGKDQVKAAKIGETSRKDNPHAILIVQPWQRVAKQRIPSNKNGKGNERSGSHLRPASGGLNLNNEADEYEKMAQEHRPIGRNRSTAKKKSAASSRGGSFSFIDLVANKYLGIKSTKQEKMQEQQDSYI
nr:hypothetical protein [Tanacetum cinerariifolium]